MKAINKVREYLKNNGISQQWLADKLDVKKTYISLLLNEKRELTTQTLEKINNLWPGVSFEDDAELLPHEELDKLKNDVKDLWL